jgi:hypothetical protein
VEESKARERRKREQMQAELEKIETQKLLNKVTTRPYILLVCAFLVRQCPVQVPCEVKEKKTR